MKDLNKLLTLSAKKDQMAFKQLYELTSPRLFRLALSYMKRPSVAEEVLQEAYIKIWDKAENYDSTKGNAIAWMSVIIRNTSMDTKRAFTSRPEEVESTYEGDDFVDNDINLGSDIRLDYVEQIENMDARLNQFKPEQRQSIIFSFFYGYTHEEISKLLGKPLGTIKTWIKRGGLQLAA